MEVAEYIHRHGFRRWYERQLIESHAYLALAFVALILLLSGIEVLGDGTGGMLYVSLLVAAAGSGAAALRGSPVRARAARTAGTICRTSRGLTR